MKIRSKLALTFLPLALVALLVLASLAYIDARNALTDQVIANLESVASKQKQQLERVLEQNRERLALVSSRRQLRLSLENYLADPKQEYSETMNRILNSAGATIGDFRELFIQTLDGRIVASTNPELVGTIHDNEQFFVSGSNDDPVELFHHDDLGQLRMYLAGPLYRDSRRLGVLVIDSDVSTIVTSTTDYLGLGETGETLLVHRSDEGHARFLTPTRFAADDTSVRTISKEDLDSPFTHALQKKEELFTEAVDYNGHAVVAVTRYIDQTDWGLVVQMRKSEAYAPVARLRTWLLLLIGVSSLALIVASLFIARSITRPITRLTEVAGRISSGDRSERALVSTHDEVGMLADTFNQMTANLIDDINERKQAEEKFQAVLKAAPDAIVIVEQSGKIVLANLQAEQLFGYDEGELIGKPLELLMPERYRRGHESRRQSMFSKPRFRPMGEDLELCGLRKDGSEIPLEISLGPIETRDGLLIISAIRDISDRKQTEARLVQQASIDSLTGLPNRLLATDRLSLALAHARRTQQNVAVMFLDIDRFKQVNDTLGHSVGDQLLREVAHRLSQCVRADDTVARLGGDEFLIILPELGALASAEILAEKILESLSQPYTLSDRELFVSASIGITGYPEDSDDPEVLMRDADAAMYRSKEAGRNTYRFFTPEMNIQLLKRMDMEAQLRYAITNNELFLHFQPLVDTRSARLVGAEALLRWRNPALGLVPADKFIPLAEETGFINAIGEWVLMQACHAASMWQDRFPDALPVSVNVSAVQFRNGDLVETVRRALQANKLPAALLEFEITERLLIEDATDTKRILKELKQMGVRLSLDDFGRGYSSLNHLKHYPFDALKIDRSFVSRITQGNEESALCKAITAMANELNLSVVAEGVETEQQWTLLRSHGTDLMQGHYISSPLDGDAFVDFMADSVGLLAHLDIQPDPAIT
ncbi:MAG: EAL domain-containing protein [Thiogranum sp.]